jgi:nucleotide-binding universal stress UspA family protein
MFKSVLVPLDGSPRSERILLWLRPLLKPGATLWLFHCIPGRGAVPEAPGSGRFQSIKQAETYLENLRNWLALTGKAVVRVGPPADRIVTASLELDVDLVALAVDPARDSATPIGHVNEAIARACPKPVLFIKPETPTLRQGVRRVLFPVDETGGAWEHFDVVRTLTAGLGAESVFLHTQASELDGDLGADLLPSVFSNSAAVRLDLIRCVQKLQREGIVARAIVTTGDKLTETLGHEQSLDADLIALGKEGHRDVHRWRPVVASSRRAVLLFERTPQEAALSPMKKA